MIRSLNLDWNFIPTNNPEIEFEMIEFNGGELHIKLNNNIDYSKIDKVIITQRIKDSNGIMKVLIAKDALQRKGVKRFDLIMPYIPYARQDRQCENGESFTLKVFCEILNSANFEKVFTFDSHSDVAPALINNCVNKNSEEYIKMAIMDIIKNDTTYPILISPDSGANKKSNNLFSSLNMFGDIVKCDKKRNTSTGNLSGFEVFREDLKGQSCIIIDDICDNGGTFMGLATELRNKNCGKLYLFVTHAILSNGSEKILKYFDGIYSTNSFNDIEGLKQFKIQI